jgi:DNA-binding NarL/FixJ family response regulator
MNRTVIIAETAVAGEVIRREMRHAGIGPVLGFVTAHRPCGAPLEHAQPELVVVDDFGDTQTAIDRIREARAALPQAKIVMITVRMDARWLAEAAAAGIDSALAKTARPGVLATLLREIVRGNVFHAFADAPEQRANPNELGLTARELEILQYVAAGGSNGEIAKALWVTEQTIKFHLSNVYRKLGVSNRTGASHYALTRGLVESSVRPLDRPRAVPVAA